MIRGQERQEGVCASPLTEENLVEVINSTCDLYWNEKEQPTPHFASHVMQGVEQNLRMGTRNHDIALAYQALALVYLHIASNSERHDLLPDVIRLYRGALAFHTQNDPNRVQIMNNLAAAYFMQHETSPSNEEHLEEAIRWAQGSLLLRPGGHPRRWESLLALNLYLSKAYALDHNQEVGTVMLKNYRELYGIMPQEHQARPETLDGFAKCILQQESTAPTVDQIREAIAVQREALAASNQRTSDHQRRASNLASALDTLFQKQPDLSIIDEAIKLYEDVLSDIPNQHTMRRDLLNNLANSYNRKSQRTRDLDTLQSTLRVRQEVLAIDPDHAQRDFTHHSLGVAHCNIYQRLGNRRHLEDAIHHLREALYLRTRGTSHWHTETVYNLAHALFLNYQLTKDSSSLESSVRFFRMTYEDRPKSHAEYLDSVSFFASALLALSKKEDSTDLLHEAIEICVRARGNLPETKEASKSKLLCTLGDCLVQDYGITSDPNTLDEAIIVLTEAVEITPHSRGSILQEVISALKMRLAIRDDQNDVDAIVRHTHTYQEELTAISAQDDFHAYVSSSSFQSLVGADDPYDADSRVEAGLRLLQQKPLDYPGRHLVCILLALDLLNPDLNLFDFVRAMEVVEEITRFSSDSSRTSFEVLPNLLQMANHVLEMHNPGRDEWRRALLSAHVATIRFLPKIAYLGLEKQELLLSTRTQNMGSAAVSHAIKIGELPLALELMEQSRAIFWQQSMRLRSKPSAFVGIPPPLAEELQTILGRLAEKVASVDEYIDSLTWPAWTRDSLTESRRLSERAEEILEEIRGIPGQENFLLGPSFDQIRQLGVHNYVVVLIYHEYACQPDGATCEAIVLAPGVSEPTRIPLREVNLELLIGASTCLEGANAQYRSALDRENPGRAMKMLSSSQKAPMEVAHRVLRDLWVSVVHPIMLAFGLQRKTGRDRPRLHWCPSGPFTSVPLHAAGHNENWCSDYVVSSYTPTLTALLEARRNPDPVTTTSCRLLLASAAHYDDLSPLPNVPDEVTAITAMVPPDRIMMLKEDEGMWEYGQEVLRRLPEATILHLACHGIQDYQYPLNSTFRLGKGRIELRDILHLNLDNAFLAFLSACETVKGFAVLQDEVFHLGSAMLFTGFQSVIGTMWSMGDLDGPALSRHFYGEIFSKETITADDVPYALDAAVQHLRRSGVPPNRWATFIHMGA